MTTKEQLQAHQQLLALLESIEAAETELVAMKEQYTVKLTELTTQLMPAPALIANPEAAAEHLKTHFPEPPVAEPKAGEVVVPFLPDDDADTTPSFKSEEERKAAEAKALADYDAKQPKISDAQLRKIFAVFKSKGITDDGLQDTICRAIIRMQHAGYEYGSRKELSKAWAVGLIDTLEKAKKEQLLAYAIEDTANDNDEPPF